EKSGAWYSFSGERIGQGRENVRQFFKDNKETFARVEGALRQKLGISARSEAPELPPIPVNGAASAQEVVKPRR
ncbi:MAG TPA: DNA recombination/repair protein RecA, partial [Acidobacteriaceae bacterium]|nr:DNA recombination/repair protein RecA [Acidobacteriaceae bacterium]